MGATKMAALHSNGAVIKIGDGGGTEVFNAIGRVTSVGGIEGGSGADIDVSDLSDNFKEYLVGMIDSGEVSLSIILDTTDTYQTALRTDRAAGTLRNFELDLTDAGPTTISFSAYVKTYGLGINIDDKITLDVSLRVSGGFTWA